MLILIHYFKVIKLIKHKWIFKINYKIKINLEGKDKHIITKIMLESYQHPDTLYILPRDCSYLFLRSINFKYIGNWDTLAVTNMQGMFSCSKFNSDISKWNTSNVINTSYMFFDSEFNSDISKWNVSNVISMIGMFSYSKFNGDISNWDILNVKFMEQMFYCSESNIDISKWNINKNIDIKNIF